MELEVDIYLCKLQRDKMKQSSEVTVTYIHLYNVIVQFINTVLAIGRALHNKHLLQSLVYAHFCWYWNFKAMAMFFTSLFAVLYFYLFEFLQYLEKLCHSKVPKIKEEWRSYVLLSKYYVEEAVLVGAPLSGPTT